MPRRRDLLVSPGCSPSRPTGCSDHVVLAITYSRARKPCACRRFIGAIGLVTGQVPNTCRPAHGSGGRAREDNAARRLQGQTSRVANFLTFSSTPDWCAWSVSMSSSATKVVGSDVEIRSRISSASKSLPTLRPKSWKWERHSSRSRAPVAVQAAGLKRSVGNASHVTQVPSRPPRR